MKARHFSELAALKQALLQAERDAAADAAREREAAARARLERELFSRSVGQVIPLRKAAAPAVARTPPEPLPRQRLRDEAAVLVESISDEFDVESLLDTDEALSFRRRGISPDVVRKLRRGVWAIQAQVDLHGLRRDAARESLSRFLREAERDGLRCVRVVHGKGNGSPGREPVLKGRVKSWLVQKAEVLAFAQARASEGGHGALVVLLRPMTAVPAQRQMARGAAGGTSARAKPR
jgi:DNA-nicking Smr family endonuclease